MSMSVDSSVGPVLAQKTALVKTGGGEYTAASVDANPALAAGLIKLKDGNYAAPIVSAAERAAAIAPALNDLKLGGADARLS